MKGRLWWEKWWFLMISLLPQFIFSVQCSQVAFIKYSSFFSLSLSPTPFSPVPCLSLLCVTLCNCLSLHSLLYLILSLFFINVKTKVNLVLYMGNIFRPLLMLELLNLCFIPNHYLQHIINYWYIYFCNRNLVKIVELKS